ncbi:RagB/SusD family nutrient uptake outer membrane protein [Mangrovibacterium diazotrophicum]|uniref:Putative outer membrane starch-binding protein n=1 Tax=Mangrovibacterium diazotrophicum TaxID=1261403 RepID=A0A419VYZ1_9BACT|nr:RagB/SusD family nutrient uptake outer membrane protein [Mangrovibacterium diazotrophicum]RKD88280.1 putative outer membrane starch-binding protein [Mangrovibacterium diazotrophicum]
MRIHITPTYLVLATVFLFSSCNGLLETAPQATVSSENFWTSESYAQSALASAYAVPLDEYYYGHNEHIWDCISDDLYCAGDWTDDALIEILSVNADNSNISALWKRKYEAISRANDIIKNVPGIESISDETKAEILGQAYFLRAWNYFRLVIIHGGVPLIDENIASDDYNQPRATAAETYAFIESDLIKSADYLENVISWDSENLGRVNWGAAMGMLAKVYLYQEKWAEAEEASAAVLAQSEYYLADDYSASFTPETRNNPEVLFALQFTPESNNGGGSMMAWYMYPGSFGGWNFFHPEQPLVDEFENVDGSATRAFSYSATTGLFTYDDDGTEVVMDDVFAERDPRLRATVISVGETYRIDGEDYEFLSGNTKTGYACMKYFDGNGVAENNSSYPVLRLSEVYLIHAEALLQQGDSGDDDINAVRARVGLPAKSNCTMDDLIHERRCELGTEGNRHFDLLRWGLAADVYASYTSPIGQPNFEVGVSELMPIPQTEIDLSEGVLTQNPGY